MANITGTLGNDTITPLGVSPGVTGGRPSNAADSILGLAGNDTIDGGGGNDTIDGGTGNDTIDGGDGNDVLFGGSGQQLDDALAANPSQPITIPYTGADGILLTSMGRMVGNDGMTYTVWRIRNGTANNQPVTLQTSQHNIVFNGVASAHSDTFVASPYITGPATHILNWASGQDTKAAGTQTFSYDTIVGNSGDDSIFGGLGNDTIDGGAGNDSLRGGDGNDSIIGGDGNDFLGGANGLDTLTGGAGNDSLSGGIENDILTGGDGKDTLTGGTGQDIFVYTSLSQSLLAGFDIITDYTGSGGTPDRIDAPNPIAPVNLTASVGNATSLSAAAIAAVLTAGAFPANTAAAFTVTGQSGTFIALNNGTAGFSATDDAIIQLQGYAIAGANPVVVI